MGAGSNSAANAATAQQKAQQDQIAQSVAAINSAYGSPAREAQYKTYGRNLNDYYTNQINTQESTNARNLKFANARSGLTGGSAAVDSGTQLAKDYTQGLLAASQNAQAGEAALRTADTNSKNQQISLAQQGNYVGQIPLATSQAQAANLQSAQNYGNANAVNNLFTGTAGIYQNEQIAAANRKAQTSPVGSIYGGTTNTASPWG